MKTNKKILLLISIANDVILKKNFKSEFELSYANNLTLKNVKNKLKQENYAVILIDYDMPDFDILKFLENIKKYCEGTSILVISKKSLSMSKVISIMKMGVKEIITHKQIKDLNDIIKKLNSISHKKRLTSEITERNHDNSDNISVDDKIFLKAIKQFTKDLIYFKDTKSRFKYLNDNMVEYFKKRNITDVLGKTDKDIFSEEHAQQAFNDEQRIIKTGEGIINYEEKETWENGTITWVSSSKIPVRDQDEEIIGILGISRDITNRKIIENELEEERFLLNSLMKYSTDNIYFKDRKSRILKVNENMKKYYESRNIKNIIGKTDIEIFKSEHSLRAFEQEQNIIKTGVPLINYEEKETWEDGTVSWVSSTKIPLRDKNENIIGIFGISRDITNLKRNEAALRSNEERLNSLYLLSQVTSFSEQEIIHITMEEIIRLTKSKLGCVLLFNEYHEEIILGKEYVDKFPKIEIIESDLLGFFKKYKDVKEPVIFEFDPENRITIEGVTITRQIAAPIIYEGNVLGVTFIANREEKYKEYNLVLHDLFTEEMWKILSRKRVENEVRKLSRAVDQSPASIIITDTKGFIEYVNPKFAEMSGYSSEEVININPRLLISENMKEEEYQKLWATITDGEKWQGELLNVKKNGELFWGFASVSPINNNYGEITNFLIISEDITEKKNAENKLKRSEEKYRNLIDNISDGIFIIDGKGIFQFANNALARIYGFDSPDKLLNKNFMEFVEPSAIKEIMESFQNFIQLRESIDEIEMPVVNTEGSIVYILAKPSIVRDGQQIIGVSGIVRNITEKKMAEHLLAKEREELKTTLSVIRDGIIVVSVDDIISKVNKVFFQLAGLGEDQLIGLHLVELFNQLEVHEISNAGENISENTISKLKNMNYDPVQKFKITVENRVHKIVTINLSSIKNEENNIEGYIFVFRDLTDIINMEKQLSLSQKLESIGELAAGIAHEINTPLQYVGDNIKFMQDSFKFLSEHFPANSLWANINSEAFSDSEIAQNSLKQELEFILGEIPNAIDQSAVGVERMSKIVAAMKDFAHPGVYNKSLADINHAIEVTMNISRNKWKYVSDIETNFQENLPLVNCLMDEMNQVFLNMIINAAHAIEEKLGENSGNKGKIKITTNSDDTHVFISINDTGKGISPKNIERIFDPFFTTKDVGKGTGQGLAISHDIVVKKHNGRINVDSQIGIGTTFTIVLPIEGKNENE